MVGVFFLLLIIFFISPLLSAITAFLILVFNSKTRNKVIPCFIFLGAFLGFINTLKTPESDLIRYLDFYININVNNLFVRGTKEPLYGVLNLIINTLTDGSIEMFIVLMSTLCYFFIFISVWKMHMKLNLSRYSFMLSIIIVLFFPNLFSLSNHLLRQFLAGSIIVFVIIENTFYKNKRYMFLLAAVLIHTTSFFFSFIYLPFLNKKMTFKRKLTISFLMFLIFSGVYSFLTVLTNLFSGIPVLGLIFKRLDVQDGAWETDNISVLSFIFMFFVLTVFFKVSKKINVNKLSLVTIFLIAFIIINYSNTEIALRFTFYTYFLFPIAIYFLPLSLSNFKNENNFSIIITPVLSIMFICWFIFKLNNGSWTYLELDKVFTFLF